MCEPRRSPPWEDVKEQQAEALGWCHTLGAEKELQPRCGAVAQGGIIHLTPL